MPAAQVASKALNKTRVVLTRSWKDQLGLFARIVEIPFCFGLFVTAAVSMGAQSNPASDVLVVFSLTLSLIAILWCISTLVPNKFIKGFFHWPVDLFFLFTLGVVTGMFVTKVETICYGTDRHVWDWSQLTVKDDCSRAKASHAFAFMSTMGFVISFLTGALMAYKTSSWRLKRTYTEDRKASITSVTI